MKKKRRIVAQKEEAAEEACGGRLSHESRVEDEGQDVPGPINCTRRSPSSSPFPIPPFLPFPSFLSSSAVQRDCNCFVSLFGKKKKFLQREIRGGPLYRERGER